MTGAPRQGSLQGLRILDLTQMLAGPYCTQMLADHGADVIKIEPPGGEPSRHVGPFHADDELRAFGGYFASVNRNKRGIVLDLKEEAGRETFLALVRTADAVIENYRVGVMERLSLSYETLREINPRLVYAAIRGFGDSRTGQSPYMAWPAYDIVAQAMGGIISITGEDASSPVKVGPGVGDLVPGLMMAFGMVAALRHAERTGEGQFLDIGMVDGVLSLCERIVHQHAFTGRVPKPEGNRHPILSPFGLVPAKDGRIAIGIADSAIWWRKLCELMERLDLVNDVRTATQEARIANQDLVYDTIGGFTARFTKAELSAKFGGVFPFAPVYDAADIARDPHFASRGMLVEVDHPGLTMPMRVAGVPVHMTATPGTVRHRAPLLGEHTQEIVTELQRSRVTTNS
jgi:crotonobetainyl-CoA:carnitine CoA-transferase CaiB-like acyl-CoA transferase